VPLQRESAKTYTTRAQQASQQNGARERLEGRGEKKIDPDIDAGQVEGYIETRSQSNRAKCGF